MEKFVVLFTAVGDHRKGAVVCCHDVGGEDAAKLHLSRGAVRKATPEEASLDKVTFADSGKDSRTIEEQLRVANAKAAELQAANAELVSENLKLKSGVIETNKPDPELIKKVKDQEKVIADLQHRLKNNQPAPEDKKK